MRPNKLLDKKLREMRERMNKFIMQEGGWIVSLPDTRTIRFECPPGSRLPELLRQAGHRVIDYGTHERLMPITERIGEPKRSSTSPPALSEYGSLNYPVS
jgi:hypothetical protein